MERIPDTTKDVWLPWLEQKGLMQATGKLFNGTGYCCLGVYALARGAAFIKEDDEVDDEGNITNEVDDWMVDINGDDINDNELLEEGWAAQHGIEQYHQALLSHLNDGGEAIVANDSPLFTLYEKHGTKVTGPHAVSVAPNQTKFLLKRHSFLEIAAIIREDL